MAHPLYTILLAPPAGEDGKDGRNVSSVHRGARASSTTQDDAALAERIRAGDRIAFDAWYRANIEAVWRFAHRYVPQADAARDVVHDVFFDIWVRRADLPETVSLRAYLFGAVRRRALYSARQTRNAERGLDVAGSMLAPGVVPSEGNAFVGDTLDDRARRLAVGEAIARLPERQRAALILQLEHDMTASDIGRALGISATAATNLSQRAIGNIRRALQEQGLID